jgi:hypothetical protein
MGFSSLIYKSCWQGLVYLHTKCINGVFFIKPRNVVAQSSLDLPKITLYYYGSLHEVAYAWSKRVSALLELI